MNEISNGFSVVSMEEMDQIEGGANPVLAFFVTYFATKALDAEGPFDRLIRAIETGK